MYRYKCEFTVNGVWTDAVVTAKSILDAKKLIRLQYQNCNITWRKVTRA